MKKILLVVGKAGPSLDYALPRVKAHGALHALVLTPLSAFNREQVSKYAESVTERIVKTDLPTRDVVGDIVAIARSLGADAVLTFSELAVWAVAESCRRLGLRGPGPGAINARNKVRMRTRWREAAVPVPAFRQVATLADLEAAWEELSKPYLLKPAMSVGSVGQFIVRQRDDLQLAWRSANAAIDRGAEAGVVEYMPDPQSRLWIAEEIIDSTTDSWYDVEGFGDYLSVEGLVHKGRYHPICITARLPTIAPFTEVSNQAPCLLSEDRQRQIEETARAAVDALGLEDCGTHTEIKLTAGRGLCLLESAARLPGAMVVREVEEVYGIDLIGLLVRALLDEPISLPERMLVSGSRRGAASIALMATDSEGKPWTSLPVFDPGRIHWEALVSERTRVEVVQGLTIPPGTPMPRYDAAAGFMNFGGLLFAVSSDAMTLQRDSYRLLDGLEEQMTGAPPLPGTRTAR